MMCNCMPYTFDCTWCHQLHLVSKLAWSMSSIWRCRALVESRQMRRLQKRQASVFRHHILLLRTCQAWQIQTLRIAEGRRIASLLAAKDRRLALKAALDKWR